MGFTDLVWLALPGDHAPKEEPPGVFLVPCFVCEDPSLSVLSGAQPPNGGPLDEVIPPCIGFGRSLFVLSGDDQPPDVEPVEEGVILSFPKSFSTDFPGDHVLKGDPPVEAIAPSFGFGNSLLADLPGVVPPKGNPLVDDEDTKLSFFLDKFLLLPLPGDHALNGELFDTDDVPSFTFVDEPPLSD